jgi:hypothetical protein
MYLINIKSIIILSQRSNKKVKRETPIDRQKESVNVERKQTYAEHNTKWLQLLQVPNFQGNYEMETVVIVKEKDISNIMNYKGLAWVHKHNNTFQVLKEAIAPYIYQAY